MFAWENIRRVLLMLTHKLTPSFIKCDLIRFRIYDDYDYNTSFTCKCYEHHSENTFMWCDWILEEKKTRFSYKPKKKLKAGSKTRNITRIYTVREKQCRSKTQACITIIRYNVECASKGVVCTQYTCALRRREVWCRFTMLIDWRDTHGVSHSLSYTFYFGVTIYEKEKEWRLTIANCITLIYCANCFSRDFFLSCGIMNGIVNGI